MKTFLIRGIPHAMQQDGWWMDVDTPQAPPSGTAKDDRPNLIRLTMLIALLCLGDALVWQVMPGLSLAVFGAAILTAAVLAACHHIGRQRLALVTGGGLLALLPLVELVQPLSIAIAVVGMTLVLALLAGLKFKELARGAARLWPIGVVQTFDDGAKLPRLAAADNFGALVKKTMRNWLMPASLGGLFMILLFASNSVAQHWVSGLQPVEVHFPGFDRMVFWLVLIPVIWTAVSLPALRERLRRPSAMGDFPKLQPLGLMNPASILRALVLFNLMFFVQTVMDLIYLYGGAALPDGLSYAEYAHRGAYPLVVTALLAGWFALISRRWVAENQMLRTLLMIWVAQNVALVISSLVRLDLYVDAYGLTRLRLSAAIWMAMVAAGLAMILWQIRQSKDNNWLLKRIGLMGAVVIYSCSWFSFDATIARYNLKRQFLSDSYYLCSLGDASKPAIVEFQQKNLTSLCYGDSLLVSSPTDWREWGFRNWRARNSLAQIDLGNPMQ